MSIALSKKIKLILATLFLFGWSITCLAVGGGGPNPPTTQTVNVAYVYNPLGQRIIKDIDSQKTVFVYGLNGELLAEVDQSGNVVREHLYLEGQPVAQVSSPSQVSEQAYYLHNDHLATPKVMTDQQGAKVWEIENGAFGEGAVIASTVEQPLRFPGQYFDKETGLHYNYYRDYDPTLGRYIQSDPIGITKDYSDPQLQVAIKMGIPIYSDDNNGRLNHLYGYASQSPISVIDAYGLETCLLTVRNSFGFGNHSALYTSSNGGDFYDPSGGFGDSNGGEHLPGDLRREFEDYHRNEGDTVEEQCKDTTPEEERRIVEQMMTRPTAAGPTCAVNVSDVLSRSGVMSNVEGGTWFPGNLSDQFKEQ